MLLTPHVLVGATIAASIPNPFIAVPLSFIAHFIGDKVPHWDFFSGVPKEEKLKGWRIFAVMGDLALGVFLGTLFTTLALWKIGDSMLAINMFFCTIASVLPDALEVPYFYFNTNNVFSGTLHNIQKKMQFQAPLPWGIISQIVVISICLVLLSNLLALA